MKFDPQPHQWVFIHHGIRNPRCAGWLPMGSGKTASTLEILVRRDLLVPIFPVLILAPYRVANSTWPEEVQKWSDFRHLQVSRVLGTADERAAALRVPADIYTMNYDNLPWLIDHHLDTGLTWRFRSIVCDESTALKGYRTRQGGVRARMLARVAWGPKINAFIELTGTPGPNGLADLWGQFWFLDKGLALGATFTAFTQRWFRKKDSGYGVEPVEHADQEIHKRVRALCAYVRVPWAEEPIIRPVWVHLGREARLIYEQMEAELYTELLSGTEITAFSAGVKSNKLMQIANGAPYLPSDDPDKPATEWEVIHDLKLDALESIISEAAGMPVLVSYNYKPDLVRILARFPQARQLDKKPETIAEWNRGEIPIMVLHPASGGHGLNLQWGGNILAMFGMSWSLEHYQQVIERIGPLRQKAAGLDRPTFVYQIMASDTVDEVVLERQRSKRDVQTLLMEAAERKIHVKETVTHADRCAASPSSSGPGYV